MLFRLSDWIALAGCVVGLGGLIGVGEALRWWGWRPAGTRRLVHAGVGLFVTATPVIFTSYVPVYVLAAAFVFVNAVAKWQRWWPGIHEARPHSWGTVMMPLALMPALAATWTAGTDRVFILQVAFLVLALADPLASWAGATWGCREWVAGGTIIGSGMFFTAALLLIGLGLLGIGEWSVQRAGVGALLVAPVVTATEAVSRRGWDNVSVVGATILVLTPLHDAPGAAGKIGLAVVIGLVFGIGAYVVRTLAAAGAVSGGLFAASLVGLGGWAWALPGFVFFVLSSALSLVSRRRSRTDAEGKNGTGRQLRQVLANGGVAWLLLAVYVLTPFTPGQLQHACYAGFLGALAAASADTWATEIGVLSSSRPWSLRMRERVEAGTSGAVSLGGTVGAALGATSVALAAVVAGGTLDPIGWGSAVAVVGAGVTGMMIDSFVGAFLQARYRDSDTGCLVERAPGPDAILVRGWRGIDNEVVNSLGTVAGALVAGLLW